MPHNISYTNIASILLKEINETRKAPQRLIPFLQERINKYDQQGHYFPLPGLNFSVKTIQGLKGIENLISVLETQRQCPSLEWSYELHQAADKRCHFLSSSHEKNILNRVANLQIGQLVSQFTSWKGHLVELTFYGFIEPQQFICELLLEDGREHKENRIEFFNRQSCFIGIGINTHEQYRFVIVLIMAMQVANHELFDIIPVLQGQNGKEQVMELDLQPQGQEMQVEQQMAYPLNAQPSAEGVHSQCNIDDCSIY